jgi:hypothetical protein
VKLRPKARSAAGRSDNRCDGWRIVYADVPKRSEVRPEEVRPEEVRPEEVRPEEVRPEEVRPEEVRPVEV